MSLKPWVYHKPEAFFLLHDLKSLFHFTGNFGEIAAVLNLSAVFVPLQALELVKIYDLAESKRDAPSHLITYD